MSDETQVKSSEPAEEKDRAKKVEDSENPKKHGSEVEGAGSEAGGDDGEGRTGTKLGSTDS